MIINKVGVIGAATATTATMQQIVVTVLVIIGITATNSSKGVVTVLVISRVIRGGIEGNMRGITDRQGHIGTHTYLTDTVPGDRKKYCI